MAWDLKNKVVVITGGADGIGFNIADKFLQEGANTIIILDIAETVGNEAIVKLRTKYGNNKALFIKCDVTTDIEAVSKEIFDSYTVDVLVNSAGIINDTMPKKTIDINVTGLIECSFKLWEHMRKDKGGNGGTIINISSVYGIITDQYVPVYQASKHAVIAFTKSLGHVVNYERSGVRVVAICPGFTETKFISKMILWDSAQQEKFEEYSKTYPWQNVDAVGEAAVEIYQRSDSGKAWMIQGGEPIVDVTGS